MRIAKFTERLNVPNMISSSVFKWHDMIGGQFFGKTARNATVIARLHQCIPLRFNEVAEFTCRLNKPFGWFNHLHHADGLHFISNKIGFVPRLFSGTKRTGQTAITRGILSIWVNPKWFLTPHANNLNFAAAASCFALKHSANKSGNDLEPATASRTEYFHLAIGLILETFARAKPNLVGAILSRFEWLGAQFAGVSDAANWKRANTGIATICARSRSANPPVSQTERVSCARFIFPTLFADERFESIIGLSQDVNLLQRFALRSGSFRCSRTCSSRSYFTTAEAF